jgi:hypothetical protein
VAQNGLQAAVRDRIVELRRVPAGELRSNPKNWRRHPEAQARALRSILERVGYADALLARETPDGLELVDGHLRAETTPDETVPVLVLDLNDEEAALLLATLDPLAEMAEIDPTALDRLLGEVEVGQAELEHFLVSQLPAEMLAARATAFLDEAADAAGSSWSAPGPGSPYFTISVSCTAEERDTIRSAIARAKELEGAETTQAAMVAVCRSYLEG